MKIVTVTLQDVIRQFSAGVAEFLIDTQHEEDASCTRESVLDILEDLTSQDFKRVVSCLTSGFKDGYTHMMIPTVSMDILEEAEGDFVVVIVDARRENLLLASFVPSQVGW